MTGRLRRTLADPRGMSLIELLVVSGVLFVMTGIVWATFTAQSATFAAQFAKSATQADLRVWVARMTRDIRNSGYDPRDTGAFGIVAPATPTDLQFTLDADRDGAVDANAAERLGYRLNGTNLERKQNTAWRVVLRGVTSLAFTYYDVNGQPVNQSSPWNAVEPIAAVQVTITAQAERGSPPATLSASALALLRNPA